MNSKKQLLPLTDSIVESYVNGKSSLKQLATLHNCSVGTIRSFLKSLNVPLRAKGRPKKEA